MNSFEEKSVKVSIEEAFPVMCEILESGGEVTFNPHGTSMLPLLRQGMDSVTIGMPTKKLKKYDIVFYRRQNGKFVLHRIVGKRKNSFVIRGDNQIENEYGITENEVVGVVTGISRGGKKISCQSAAYWFYVIFLRPLRGAKMRLARVLRKFKSR